MLKSFTTLASALILASISLAAFAQERTEMRSYFSFDYDHVFDGSDRRSDDGNGGSFGFGSAINRFWGLESNLFYDEFDSRTNRPAHWREYGAKVNGMFFYSRDPSFSPYFGLGAGGIRSELITTNRHSTDPFVDVGLGYFTYFALGSQDIALRVDGRYRWLDIRGVPNVGRVNEPIVKLGIVIPLGARPTIAVAEATPPKPVTRYEASPKRDTDGDGVYDDQDDCPGTPRGVMVDASGCPEAKASADVRTRTFESVHFDFNRANLTTHSRSILDNAASVIGNMAKKFSSVKVEVGGHTDSIGTEGYNQALSERRAQIVTNYLARKGVNPKSMSTSAYGKTSPEATNETEAGRAYNRRVEVKAIAE